MSKQINSIIHVGHNGSPSDFNRIVKTIRYLCEHQYNVDDLKSHFMNLGKGQDFLTDEKTYDVVVLHFLFRGGFGVTPTNNHDPMATSPKASWGNWIRRLIGSQAQLVFAFGGFAEVSGGYICNLDGYERIQLETELYLFKKL